VAHRMSGLVIIILAAAMAVAVAGCGAAPPDIADADIVAFGIGGIPSETMGREGLAEPYRPLDWLVAAYNAADGARWRVDTTPSLFVSIDLVGGMGAS
jgi:hypothetical protein